MKIYLKKFFFAVDSEVEFSYPENFKSMENAENATTLITQEIETHVLHPLDPPRETLKGNFFFILFNYVLSL